MRGMISLWQNDGGDKFFPFLYNLKTRLKNEKLGRRFCVSGLRATYRLCALKLRWSIMVSCISDWGWIHDLLGERQRSFLGQKEIDKRLLTRGAGGCTDWKTHIF